MAATISNAERLRELWVHTGTACNLECPFCLEGSRPGDNRLERPTLADLKSHFDAASQLGVERFIFTGGEPLIVKDIVKILHAALALRPALVLSNGTAPLLKRAHQLAALRQTAFPLSYRISLDHPDEARHDAERGWGNFKRALEGLKVLHSMGFSVSVARHAEPGEDTVQIVAHYRELMAKQGLPEDIPLVSWLEFGHPTVGPSIEPPTLTELAESPHALMCRRSRMLVKIQGSVRVYACSLTDDDRSFDLGQSLAESLVRPFALRHRRCGRCVRQGVDLT